MRWSDTDSTFLLTSDDDLPDFGFRGTCFVGSDFISGSGGANRYRRDRGASIPVGADGAYAVLDATGPGAWRLGTDYKGFCHVFYHFANGYWAVTNSFMALVRHLRSCGIATTPDPASIASWGSGQDLVRALMSFRTGVREIRLLPSTSVLQLRRGPHAVLELERVDIEPQPVGSYVGALGRYLDVWSARFRTVFADPRLASTFHITGGRDSRTVLAMAMPTLLQMGPEYLERIRFFSQVNRADDFAVASRVADSLGLTLNRPTNWPNARPLSAREAFLEWDEASAGAYSHLSFPSTAFNNATVTVAGVGGEAHRRVYRPRIAGRDIAGAVEVCRERFPSSALFEEWQASLVEADDYLRSGPAAHPKALVRNHREFRDRFHSGKMSIWAPNMLALCSKYLTECSNLLRPPEFRNAQLTFDIMHNTTPALLELPYDVETKTADDQHRRKLIDIGWSPSDAGGQVYMEEVIVQGPRVASELPTPLACMLADTESVLQNRAAIDLFGTAVLEKGVRTLQTHRDAEVQNLHGLGRDAHLAYLANMMFVPSDS